MANRLREAGEEIRLLAIVDSISVPGMQHIKLGAWLARRDAQSPGQWINAAARLYRMKLRDFYNRYVYFPIARALLFPIWEHYRKTGKPLPRLLRCPDRANALMNRDQFRQLHYDGDALYFQAMSSRVPRQEREAESWRKIIRGTLTLVPIDASHRDIVRDPAAQEVARHIEDALAARHAET